MMRVYQCEDSLTGILTGVYDAWDSRLGHGNVRLSAEQCGNLELFCEYVQVEPDVNKAEKVFRTIEKRLGREACEMIAQAAAYPDDGKADAIYRMIVLGLHLPDGKDVCGMLTRPEVRLVFELSRKVWHIAHRYMGFVRFRETGNGILLAEIGAEADILALVAPHFADRLPQEDWVIYDRNRRRAAVHPKAQSWFLLDEVDEETFSVLQDSDREAQFQALWKSFHKVIGIDARKNRRAQMSFLPLKFRPFMNEFG